MEQNDDPGRPAVGVSHPFGHRPDLIWLMLGGFWGGSRALARLDAPTASVLGYAASLLEAFAIVTACWLAGRVIRMFGGLAEAAIASRPGRSPVAPAEGATSAAERPVDDLHPRPAAPDRDRPRLLAEIGQALRAGRPDDAERLLDDFEIRFAGDPAVSGLRERLEAARREALTLNLDQLDAARRANDPDRVLELYRAAGPSMEHNRRADLEGDLGRWFLELIHRRLRIIPIQPEVVRLATDVAETFAATSQGASLRASLPMLRRAVGLCPRCAQPYTGSASACPQCLGTPSLAPVPVGAAPDSPPGPEADDPDGDPDASSANGRDSDWLRYNEDDRDDLNSPA